MNPSKLFMMTTVMTLTFYAYMLTNLISVKAGSVTADLNVPNEALVEALKKVGGFDIAATFLDAVDLKSFIPDRSTLLVPMDTGVMLSELRFSTYNVALPIMQYHVITEHLTFHQLKKLPVGRTLDTLLQNNTIMVTNNSATNYTLDDVPVSRPNIYLDAANSFAVHGISGVMKFQIYGKLKVAADSPSISGSPTAASGQAAAPSFPSVNIVPSPSPATPPFGVPTVMPPITISRPPEASPAPVSAPVTTPSAPSVSPSRHFPPPSSGNSSSSFTSISNAVPCSCTKITFFSILPIVLLFRGAFYL